MPSVADLAAGLLPDRDPTWTDVAMAVLAVVWLPVQFLRTTPPLGWVALGFGSVWVALGPLARTDAGARLDAWFARIGVAGRVVVVTTAAVAIGTVLAVVEASRDPVLGVSVGVFAAIPPFVCLHVLVAGRPRRWRTE
ncbi:hypothetical protein [Halobaculum lipolyticum]|uniref:DUF3054 domain-containing protein n=1 Tax=Halobaculum lipolyticum TaxID=3032001 RepID=A0ABD5WIC4_9EURY|nr:hypothetical protein [Halobaculum sp. DT31]